MSRSGGAAALCADTANDRIVCLSRLIRMFRFFATFRILRRPIQSIDHG